MDLLDDVRAAEVQHLGDVLVAQPVALQVERAGLEVGAHRAVEDDDAPAGEFEQGRFHSGHGVRPLRRVSAPRSAAEPAPHPSVHPDGLLDARPAPSRGPQSPRRRFFDNILTSHALSDFTVRAARFIPFSATPPGRRPGGTSPSLYRRGGLLRRVIAWRISSRLSFTISSHARWNVGYSGIALGSPSAASARIADGLVADVVRVLHDRAVHVTLLDPRQRLLVGVEPDHLHLPELPRPVERLEDRRRAAGEQPDEAAEVGVLLEGVRGQLRGAGGVEVVDRAWRRSCTSGP